LILPSSPLPFLSFSSFFVGDRLPVPLSYSTFPADRFCDRSLSFSADTRPSLCALSSEIRSAYPWHELLAPGWPRSTRVGSSFSAIRLFTSVAGVHFLAFPLPKGFGPPKVRAAGATGWPVAARCSLSFAYIRWFYFFILLSANLLSAATTSETGSAHRHRTKFKTEWWKRTRIRSVYAISQMLHRRQPSGLNVSGDCHLATSRLIICRVRAPRGLLRTALFYERTTAFF